jgi:hypothetical protein
MDADFLSSAEWLAARDAARARDGNACTVARLLGGTCRGVLHVHHIIPRSERPDLALDLDNLGTACASHHPRWEALRRALAAIHDEVLPPCPHRHPYASGRRECEERRRRARQLRRLARLVPA